MKYNKSYRPSLKLATVFTLGLMLCGCIKQRPDKFVDNSGLDKGLILLKSEALKSDGLTIKTKSLKANESIYNFTMTVEDSARDSFDSLDVVTYETNSSLIPKGLSLKGMPDYTYDLKYELNGDKLLIYKIGQKDSIPYFERSSLLKKSFGDKIGVPITKCDVSYYNITKNKDDDGRQTNIIVDVKVEEPSLFASATHIMVNRFSCEEIDYVLRAGMFPVKWFAQDKEWYLSAFKTNASDYVSGGNSYFGIWDQRSGSWGVFRRVQFRALNENTLQGVNSALDPKIKKNLLNNVGLMPFSVEWKAYKKKTLSTGAIEEVENQEVPFSSADYVKIDFIKSFKGLSEKLYVRSGSKDLNADNLKEVIIADNMLSFILTGDGGNVEYRVNLLLRNSENDYIAVSAEEKDGERFGSFNIQTPIYDQTTHVSTVADKQKITRKMRFNPKNKTITYHISEGSPKNDVVTRVAQTTVRRIDKSFKNAVYKDDPSKAIRIVLSPKRVRRGDPRYNIIDFNSEQNFNTILGLGMPHFDEVTGEVISATAYTYYGAYERIIRRELLKYLQIESGMRDPNFGLDYVSYGRQRQDQNSYIDYGFGMKAPFLLSAEDRGFFDQMGVSLLGKQKLYPLSEDSSYNCIGGECGEVFKKTLNQKDEYATKNNYINDLAFLDKDICSSNAESYITFKFEKLKRHCPNLSDIVKKFKDLEGSAAILDYPQAKDCINSYLVERLVWTTTHEILHNFGVAHNFMGSADEKNHLNKEMIKEVYNEDIEYDISSRVNSSSIMDYGDSIAYLGKYDWAALRYIYRDKVEGESLNQSIDLTKDIFTDDFGVKVKRLKPIAKAESDAGIRARKYEFCSNFDSSYGSDPMCAMWDAGVSPSDAVSLLVDQFEYVTKYFSRKGLSASSSSSVMSSQWYIMNRLNRFYSTWRTHLYNILGESKKYLEGVETSQDFYDLFFDKLSGLDEQSGNKLLEYYNVRSKIYELYRDTIFEAPLTCVFTYDNQALPIDFDQVYTSVAAKASLRDEQVLVEDCKSPAIFKEAVLMLSPKIKSIFNVTDLSSSDIKYVGSIGTPFYSYNYDANANRTSFDRDVTGIVVAKNLASQALSLRLMARVFGKSEYFMPNMLDEPEFRENYEYLLNYRIKSGFWFNTDRLDTKLGKLNRSQEVLNLAGPIVNSKRNKAYRSIMQYSALNLGLADKTAAGQMAFTSIVAQNDYIKALVKGGVPLSQAFQILYKVNPSTSYITESQFLRRTFGLFRSGLNVPGDQVETDNRTKTFNIGVARADYISNLGAFKREKKYTADIKMPGLLGDIIVYPKDEEALFAKDLITQLDELSALNSDGSENEVAARINDIISNLNEIINDAYDKPHQDFALFSLAFSDSVFKEIGSYASQVRNTLTADDKVVTKFLLEVTNLIERAMSNSIQQIGKKGVMLKTRDLSGKELSYTDAWLFIKTEQTRLQRAQQQPSKQLQDFFTAAGEEMNVIQSSYPVMDDDDKTAFVSQDGLKGAIESIGKSLIDSHTRASGLYRSSAAEFDEKKIILNDLLKILAWF